MWFVILYHRRLHKSTNVKAQLQQGMQIVKLVWLSEVKFAHFAARRNFTHAVTFTAAGNFTCPKGQT